MYSKKLDSDRIIKKLMDIWKGDPINSFKTLLRNLDNDYIIFDNPTQKLLNTSFTNSLKDNKIDSTVEFKNEDDELQKLPSGKEIIKDNVSVSDDNSLQDKDVQIKISFTKDVLPYVIPLTCILTIENKNKDFINMLNKKNIVYIKQYDNACEIFKKDVEIKGGVNYFLIDHDYDGLCNFNGSNIKLNNFDILVDNKYLSLINRLNNFDNITNIFNGRYFNIETNDKNLSNDDKLIKCYVSQQKGFIKYIDKKYIKHNYDFYKLITPTGCHGAYSGFGNFYILKNNEIHTTSYVQFKIANIDEANSLLSYLKCKLPNFMLSLRKNSQLISNNTCKWIPLVSLNKLWTDDEVYKYFKLSEDEIKLIKETKIIGYNDKPINKNEQTIIKDGRKQYYLINDELYKIKKDKSQGKLFGKYINGKIIEEVIDVL
jgi:hypothetical protein